MASNFNMKFDSNGLTYNDAAGNTVELGNGKASTLAFIAPEYSKKTYAAKSLVSHDGKLYYNSSAINTAENWTAAHWTECTVASYCTIL